MGKRHPKRINIKPVLSAFVWGVLVAVGIDPGQLLFETAVRAFGVYLQFAAIALLVIAVYLSYSYLIEAIRRSTSAYRTVGLLGVVGVLLAFLAGFVIFQWERPR